MTLEQRVTEALGSFEQGVKQSTEQGLPWLQATLNGLTVEIVSTRVVLTEILEKMEERG